MRPDSRPVTLTLNLPSLSDETVVEIQDFLHEILEHFAIQYGHQIDRFYEDHSYNNLVHPGPDLRPPDDDPPF